MKHLGTIALTVFVCFAFSGAHAAESRNTTRLTKRYSSIQRIDVIPETAFSREQDVVEIDKDSKELIDFLGLRNIRPTLGSWQCAPDTCRVTVEAGVPNNTERIEFPAINLNPPVNLWMKRGLLIVDSAGLGPKIKKLVDENLNTPFQPIYGKFRLRFKRENYQTNGYPGSSSGERNVVDSSGSKSSAPPPRINASSTSPTCTGRIRCLFDCYLV